MPIVTVCRGFRFGDAVEINDIEFPCVPRVGETVSLFDNDHATFEKVREVNYHCGNGIASARILVAPGGGGKMAVAPLAGR